MSISKWVYRLSDGAFQYGGFYEPSYDPATHGMAEFGDADPHPDVRMERFDAASPTKRRVATATEVAAYDAAQIDAQATAEINNVKVIKALGFVLLQHFLGRNPTSIERQQFLTDVKTAYKTL